MVSSLKEFIFIYHLHFHYFCHLFKDLWNNSCPILHHMLFIKIGWKDKITFHKSCSQTTLFTQPLFKSFYLSLIFIQFIILNQNILNKQTIIFYSINLICLKWLLLLYSKIRSFPNNDKWNSFVNYRFRILLFFSITKSIIKIIAMGVCMGACAKGQNFSK